MYFDINKKIITKNSVGSIMLVINNKYEYRNYTVSVNQNEKMKMRRDSMCCKVYSLWACSGRKRILSALLLINNY